MLFCNLSVCLLSVLFCVAGSAPADEHVPLECPTNEKYYRCSLIVCQKSCRELLVPSPCPGVSPDCYKPACLCEKGYLRNDEGTCVPEYKCEKKCEKNEEFHDCIYSICRPQDCYDQNRKHCEPVNPKYCISGCVCKENFLRSNQLICVPKDQCSV